MVAIIWGQEPYGAPSFDHAMESRRLVVLISTAILGFQGVTLAFDLLNCTALSWLYVRLNGFGPAPPQVVQQPAVSRFNRVDGRFALSSCDPFGLTLCGMALNAPRQLAQGPTRTTPSRGPESGGAARSR